MKKPHFLFYLMLIIPLIVVSGSMVGYYLYQHRNERQNITLHGNVDIRQVDLGFRVAGRLAEIYFDEGDPVKKGNIIAKLDKVPFIYDLEFRKAQMESATHNYEKFQSGNRPQEILEARALVREREVTYFNAEKNRIRQEELIKRKLAAQQTYDDALTQEKAAEAQLKNAKEALNLVLEGFRVEDIASAKAQLEAAKAQLATAENNLQDTDLIAPSEGIILTRIREPGSILTVGEPVVTLSLTHPIWIRAYLSETDLGRVKPGMKTLVYTDAAPKHPFEGQIGYISPEAEFTPKNVETKELRTALVYRIRVVVNDPNGQLRQGLPVDVVILLANQHDR